MVSVCVQSTCAAVARWSCSVVQNPTDTSHLAPWHSEGTMVQIFVSQCNKFKFRIYIYIYKVKWSRYRPGVAQRVSRGIAVLFHDRGTRRGWVVRSAARSGRTLPPGNTRYPVYRRLGGPQGRSGKSRPHWDSIPDRPARSQSLYRLSYPAHTHTHTHTHTHKHTHIYIYIYRTT